MAITTNAELETAVTNWIGDTSSDFTARVPEFIVIGENWINRTVRCRFMEEMVDLRLEAAQDGGDSSGTDTITVALSGFTGPAYGDTVTFTAGGTNTGAATLNVQSTGAVAIRKRDGSSAYGALEARDIVTGHDYTVYYDGSVWRLVPRGGVPLPSRFLGARRVYIDRDPVRPLESVTSPQFWSTYLSAKTGIPSAYTIDGEFIVFGYAPDANYAAKMLYWRRPQAIATAVDRLFAEFPDLYLYAALVHASPFLEDDGRALTWAAALKDIVDQIHRQDRGDRFSASPLQSRSGINGG